MDHTVWYRSDIQDYFEYILKKHREKTVNPSIKIFTIKTGYYQQEIKTGYYLHIILKDWNYLAALKIR